MKVTDLRIAFRVDASLDIGTGHVMRCLTLAGVLRDRGAHCFFVTREHPGNLIDLIRQRGFDAHLLPHAVGADDITDPEEDVALPGYSSWLGTGWVADARQTIELLGGATWDWLIVDHYALDARWEQQLRNVVRRIMVIDDLADRPHDCDLLLDQNLGRSADAYRELLPQACRVLTGPAYALIHPRFSASRPAKDRSSSPPSNALRILVAMGGVDQHDATSRVLEGLKQCPLPSDSRITVVMGAHAPWLERVQELAAGMPWPTEVKINVEDMAQLMAEHDLAVGAAGTTAWERCCMGLPTLLTVLADNQQNGAASLEKNGAVVLLNRFRPLADELAVKLPPVLDPETLGAMSRAGMSVTDGRGVFKIAAILTHANN